MNIIFMGTPDFAIPSIEKILSSRHKISAIVTAPDKERGRGKKITYTPVKELALLNNIPLLQPVKLKDEAFINELKKFDADLFVVVAFRILPPDVYNIPKSGSFNLHASLLPKFRGAAPIQWAIIKGEKETGVTTFKIEEKVDTGNVYLQEKINIDAEDDFGTLHDKLSLLGADLVLRTIDLIEEGDYELKQQDGQSATPAPKITKETGFINWNSDAVDIHNLIRGLSPYPAAYFFLKNKMIKVYKSEVVDKNYEPGSFHQEGDNLIVGCLTNSLKINELQLEGKKRMGTPEFLRGFNISSR
jgi:methionyl-tRNA formyltransferase